jgi:hypothetical protein
VRDKRNLTRILAVAVLALGTAAGCASPAIQPGKSPRPSPDGGPASSSPAQAGPTPVVAARWSATHIGGGAVAVAIGAGHLWVAYYRPAPPASRHTGEFVGYGLRNGRADVSVPIGGAPAAVAVSGSNIWVADSVGDGSPPTPAGMNMVLDFTPDGHLTDSFRVPGPQALAAIGNSVWVYSSRGSRAVVTRLTPGGASAPPGIALPGSSAAGAFGAGPLLACGANVYAVSTDLTAGRTYVSRLGAAAASAVATVQATSDVPSLACGPAGRPSLLLPGQTPVLLAGDAFHAIPVRTGPSAVIRGSGRLVWLVNDQDGTLRIATLANATSPASRTLTQKTSTASLLIATAARDLWVVMSAFGRGDVSLHVERVTEG